MDDIVKPAVYLDEKETAHITLGGKSWDVPILSARQNKLIDPIILSLLPLFNIWQTDRLAAVSQLKDAQYEALQEIAFQAIRKASPNISKETFLELPITLPELIAAFPIIAEQTGIFSRGDADAGEEQAGNARTGTASSPMSAI